jgi:hypothetical protein
LTDPPDQDNTVDAILAKSPPLSLDIPEGTSFEHWLALGKHLALVDNTLAWRIGDWWVYGEHRYGDRIAAIRTRRWNGPSFGACRNYAMVARAFETSRRRDTLSFSHHREVASLSTQDADRLLDWAEQPLRNDGRPRSTRELRSQVRTQVAARRRLNGSRTGSADIADATSSGPRTLERREQTERLHGRVLPFAADLKLDHSANVLPVPAELAALRVEPRPDLDRLAIARAALSALDSAQRLELLLEQPGELHLAYALLIQRYQPTQRGSSVG